SERLANTPSLNAATFTLLNGRVVQRPVLVSLPDVKKVDLDPKCNTTAQVLAVDLSLSLTKLNRFLVPTAPRGSGVWLPTNQVFNYTLKVPHPVIEVGVGRMVRDAGTGNRPWLLILAVIIFPVTFIVTSIRWHALLKALEINLTLGRSFALN